LGNGEEVIVITLRREAERGHAKSDWLDSKHTFSFGLYYDQQHMGFSALRVINDDRVKPNAGFDTHGHRDMEIITYVLKGNIVHKDSAGNEKVLPAGEFQLMSAGSGIYHSEFNASASDELRLLQIWIEPNTLGGEPGYQQKDFGKAPGLTAIATSNGENETLHIKQDATLYQLILKPNSDAVLPAMNGRKVFVHQVEGVLSLQGFTLEDGDAAKIEGENDVLFTNVSDSQVTALVFDLP
jgi:redox-sensitive bicupin YhaK (pirin superfamily)